MRGGISRGWVGHRSDTGSSGLRACLSPTRMLQTLEELEARSSEAKAKATAFQHLLLLVGIHLFKVRQPGKDGVMDLGSVALQASS